jgi:hypothetical protein
MGGKKRLEPISADVGGELPKTSLTSPKGSVFNNIKNSNFIIG